MRRYALVFIFFAIALLFTIQLTSADASLKVHLAQTKADVSEAKIHLTLAIDNASGRSLQTNIFVEILDPQNHVLVSAEKAELIKPALHRTDFALSLEDIVGRTNREIFWYRLRYRLVTNNQTTSGILALSEIAPDFFELRVAAPSVTIKGNRYTIQVVAARPITSEPVSGVKITGEIKYVTDETEKAVPVSGVTSSEGSAIFNFALPDSISEREIDLRITGEYKGLVQEIEDDIQVYPANQILINSDKLIYQPGQALHVRALLLDTNRHALADQDVTLKIYDEDQSLVYRAALKTSRFGIASSDWQIPANIRLGNYGINFFTADNDSDSYGYWYSDYKVRISRYELPNFTVIARPDRSYYLPGQTPEVEVRGDYLFGQPVRRGHIKIVRETDRQWNFREQKWDIQEEDKQEGELDKDGRFLARLNLSKAQKELEENDDRRFQDVTFTAYLTDPTTNRTEQRRFDVRLTRQAIHVYFIRGRLQSREFPSEFYLSTYYADGTPARCQVAVNEVIESKDESLKRQVLLRTVKTNRYGVAKVGNLFIHSLNDANHEVPINFTATDGKGLRGSYTSESEVRFVDLPMVRVKTDKPLYHAGEPISLQVAASKTISSLFVEVQARTNWQQLFSKTLHLTNGQAQLTIPYQKNFKGELSVLAYTNLGRKVREYEYPCDSRSVLYQNDEELKIAVTASQAEYRPGDEASVALRVNAQNAGVESALGVTVFDKAVDERTRTDNKSRSPHSPYDSYLESSSKSEQISAISRRTLNQLDLSKPLAKDLQLVAEILFSDANYPWRNLMGTSYIEDYEEVFKPAINKQFAPLLAVLDTRYRTGSTYPTKGTELRRELGEFNLDFDALRDPWGMPYRDRFYIEQSAQRLDFVCAGVDRKFGSDDDFVVAATAWKYLKPVGEALDRALKNHHQRTGGYIGDLATLKAEMAGEGVDLSTLRDPWGKPYRIEFGILRSQYTVAFLSGGPNGHFEPDNPSAGFKVRVQGDDFTVWTSKIDYTTEMKAKLEKAFNKFYQINGRLPQNDDQLAAALNAHGIDRQTLKDGRGRPLYAIYKTESVYGDRMRVYSFNTYSKRAKPTTEITPVTRQLGFITLRSPGEDGRAGTPDDFDVAGFSRIIAEQAAGENKPAPSATIFPVGTGSIRGLVTDSLGAAIAGAKLTATNKATGAEHQTTSNDEGRYLLTPLAAGTYEIKLESSGFSTIVITEVPVSDSQTTELNVDLKIGSMTETVTVTAAETQVQTQANFSAETIQASPLNSRNFLVVTKSGARLSVDGGQARSQAIATPRLREYFPETLYWQPEVITDTQGRAEVKFKLADNITTWKFSALASTTDGRIGVVEKEIRAFQPFFAELDPPRTLTEGDEIALPVVLRNYLDKPQSINVELKPESWFAITGAAKKQTTVKAGDAERTVFDIRTLASIKDGKQRVTAMATEASDAIEKPVTVHPDGEEIAQNATQIFGKATKFEIDIPESAIKNSTAGELKIYPNLAAHVFESVEAIMRRPYGCAEQTISAAYPSLLAFHHLTPEDHSPVGERARRYLQLGYEKLLAYRMEDGGFSYWGRGASDTALSAYALKFLSEASSFIAVDDEVIKAAQMAIIKKQQSDGSWEVTDWQGKRDPKQTLLLTAYVARALGESAKGALQAEGHKATERALNFLVRPVEEFDEPYIIASYALAAMKADDRTRAARAVDRLQRLARNEADGSYWALETNTPFYGWGLAGRVETTALAVKALAEQNLRQAKSSTATSPPTSEALINRGLNFLLRNKDRYGVWYSTQATVNVLEALMTILSTREAGVLSEPPNDRAEIIVNGKAVDTLDLPETGRLTNPLTVDLSKVLTPGKNLVEIRRTRSVQASAQTVVSFYQPWLATNPPTKSQALRLAINFDKPQAKIGEEVTCKVEAERIGFRGYGMMLAEVGLPPGADVDRASLERTMTDSGWDISQYDVLPDRVIVYLWPRAGGTKFQFKFRPRFGINAQSAASVLYDYYNPEAQMVVAPTKFVVR
jgi:uncharacterized protein YfaS (alpha-2-macroglobulin family)